MVAVWILRDHGSYWEIASAAHIQGVWKSRPRMGFIPHFAVGLVWAMPWDELCELSWGIWQVGGLSSKMDHVLECECPNSAEVTWEKCLNTDYSQRLMNSVLQ